MPVNDQNSIALLIKKRLKSSKAIMRLFDQYDISPDRLDDLEIVITDLDQKYAETDSKTCKINKNLFHGGVDEFFDKYFFILPHEIVHFCTRISESEAWLNDPEECLGFVMSIAYERERGSDFNIIYNRIYPKISWHFHNEAHAREFFKRMWEKSEKFLRP